MDELAGIMSDLDHANPARRERALALLAEQGAEAVPTLRRALNFGFGATRPLAAELLVGLGAASLEALCDALADPDREARVWAVWALARIPDPGAAPVLLTAFADQDPWIRRQAIEGVATAPGTQVSRSLCRMLKDPDSTIRQLAAQVLGPRRDAASVPPLCESLWDVSLNVRAAAIRALGEIGSGAAVPALLERLDDPTALVRREAARALGAMEALPAARPLSRALTSRDVQLRQAAADALVAIGRAHRSVPLLVAEALCAVEAWERAVPAEVLTRIGEGSIPAVCALLRATHPSIRKCAAGILRQLAEEAPSPQLRDALPMLRRETGAFSGNSERTRQEYRATLQAIETATQDLRHLPLPSVAPAPSLHELPIVAAEEEPDLAVLPLPAAEEECEEPASERTTKPGLRAYLTRVLRSTRTVEKQE
jgi:HEAT repeat protein